MNVSGKTLHNKVRELMPGLSATITPEVLMRTCEDPKVQPFLTWFCTSVKRDNVLLPEDIRLKKHIQKKGEWLEGKELDEALAEATKDCPELMKLLDVDRTDETSLLTEMEAEKTAYNEDMDYLKTMQESIRNLGELETKLDDDIETEESEFDKDRIQVDLAYNDCINVLEEFDLSHRQFFRDIENLVRVYSDAVEKKGTPILWTQLPLDLFIKQMENHNKYLGVYIKRHFGGQVEPGNDSDYGTLMEDGKERCGDYKVHELLNCQTNVITSKTDEIHAKVDETVTAAMANHAIEIYNNGNLKTPRSETQLRAEIASLTGKRDILEEDIELLRETQLEEYVRQYAKLVITNILINDGHARVERRKNRLEKLDHLRLLAREKGHGHSDLLCMLMQLQLRRLKEIVEFIADARHYLATEYSLSSLRSDTMQQLQGEYDEIMNAPPSQRNVFNKALISLMGTESGPDEFNEAIKQYDKLVGSNEIRKKNLLGVHLDTKIANLEPLKDEIMAIYNTEVGPSPTNSLKPTPYSLLTKIEDSTKNVNEIQSTIDKIRTKIKEMNKKTAGGSFDREATILWQRFLANPDEMQSIYDEAKRKVESSHFVNNLN